MDLDHGMGPQPFSGHRPISHKGLAIATGALMALLILGAGVAFWNALQMRRDDAWIAHTDEVLDALEGVISTMKDAETGQRGYLITGEDGYLEPYNAAVATIQDKVQRLQRLAADNPGQQDRVRLMEEQIAAKLQELQRTVALRKKDPEAARQIVSTGQGQKLMDAIRAQVQAMQGEERNLLTVREQRSRQSYRVTVLTILFSLASGLGMVATLVYLVQHQRAERKQAERWQARLAAIVESSGDAILSKDLDGVIQTWNAGARRLFGYEAEEVIGRSVTLLLPPERLQEESQILARVRSGRRVEHMETVRVAKDGKRIDISWTVSPVKDRKGRIIGASTIARDITDFKRKEMELQAAKEAAEAASVAKSQFLANMSHELRTPMNAIVGMTDLALGEDLSATLRDYLQTVKQSADGLLELVNEILDLSRIEAGGLQLEVLPFDLAKTVEQVVKTLGVRACEKGLELVCDLGNVPAQVVGDPLRLRQVLLNLVGNAVKFTCKGTVVVQRGRGSRGSGERRRAVHRGRHGPRHRPSGPRTDLCAVYSGRRLDHAPIRRDRPGTGHHPPPGRSHGRADLGRERAGQGEHLPLHGTLGSAKRRRRRTGAARRRPGSPPRLAGPRCCRISRYQSRPCGDAAAVVDEAGNGRGRAGRPGKDLPGGQRGAELPFHPGRRHAARDRRIHVDRVAAKRRRAGRSGHPDALRIGTPYSSTALPGTRRAEPGEAHLPVHLVRRNRRGVGHPRTRHENRRLGPDNRVRGTAAVVARPAGRGYACEPEVVHLYSQQARACRASGPRRAAGFGSPQPARVRRGAHGRADAGHGRTRGDSAIRGLADPKKARVPIIALTAHALTGDADRCLGAGMDGYISKPIDREEMIERVERLAGNPGKAGMNGLSALL